MEYMNFEIVSEENHNLCTFYSPLITEEMVEELDDRLRDGLIQAPYLVMSGAEVERIEHDAFARLDDIGNLIDAAGGKMYFVDFNEALAEQIGSFDFSADRDLFEVVDEIEALILDQELDDEDELSRK